MALNGYMQQSQRLIRDIQQMDTNPEDLIGYINEGRVQLAGESKSIRVMGTLSVAAKNPGPYPFSSIVLAGSVGVAGVLDVEQIWYQVGTGQLWVRPRPWPWFSLYELNNAAPNGAPPKAWSQYGQGENGTIYLTLPDVDYTLNVDTVGYPSALALDTDPEAIPAPWTTAIPYYAAYLALLAAQNAASEAAADKMFARYEAFVDRGRKFTTPGILPTLYAGVPNPVRGGQLGQVSQGGG